MKKEEIKITREWQQTFLNYMSKNLCKEKNEFYDFSKYCYSLRSDLLSVKKHYKDEFNKQNTITIDEYIAIFDDVYEKYENYVSNPEIINEIKKGYTCDEWKCVRFHSDLIKKFLRNNLFKKCDNETCMIDNEVFENVKEITKQIFMLEKFCSFTTKKFWKNELSNINEFMEKQNSEYGFIAQVIFSFNWRNETQSMSLDSYFNKKTVFSASYISDKKTTYFGLANNVAIAGLLYSSAKSLIFGSAYDSMTEERIDGKNPLSDKVNYTNIDRVAMFDKDGELHEIYGTGTEISTPKSIMDKSQTYNEIVLDRKHDKPVAVFYADKSSYFYAKFLAKKYKLKKIILLQPCEKEF